MVWPMNASARNGVICDGSGIVSASAVAERADRGDDDQPLLALGSRCRRSAHRGTARSAGTAAPCRTSRSRSMEMPALRAKNGIVVATKPPHDAVGNAGEAEQPRRWVLRVVVGHRWMSSLSAAASDEQGRKDPKGVSRRELLTFWRKPLESAVKTIKPPPPPEAPIVAAAAVAPAGHAARAAACRSTASAAASASRSARPTPSSRSAPTGARPRARRRSTRASSRACCAPACSAATSARRARSCRRTRQQRRHDGQGAASTRPRCLTHHGQACTACDEHCPRPGALVFDGRTASCASTSELCVGCGLCEHFCPTEPHVDPRAAARRELMLTVVDALSSPVSVRLRLLPHAHRRRAHRRASTRSSLRRRARAAGAISRSTSSPPTSSIARRRRSRSGYRGISHARRRLRLSPPGRLRRARADPRARGRPDARPTTASRGARPTACRSTCPRAKRRRSCIPSTSARRAPSSGSRRRRRRSSASTGASTPRATSAPTASPAATPSSRRRAASARCRTGIAAPPARVLRARPRARGGRARLLHRREAARLRDALRRRRGGRTRRVARARARRPTSWRASRRACPGATTPACAARARSSRSAARRATDAWSYESAGGRWRGTARCPS